MGSSLEKEKSMEKNITTIDSIAKLPWEKIRQISDWTARELLETFAPMELGEILSLVQKVNGKPEISDFFDECDTETYFCLRCGFEECHIRHTYPTCPRCGCAMLFDL